MTISYRRGAAAKADSSSTTVAATYSSNNYGDAAWVGIGWDDPSGAIDVSTIVDTARNTWATTGKVRNASMTYSARIYYVPGPMKASGSNTVTITLSSAASFKRLSLLEYKSSNGPWTSNPVDQSTGSTGNSASMSPGSMTPTTDNQLLVGFGASFTGSISASSPYVIRQPSDPATTGLERILVGGAGVAVSPLMTISGATQWVMLGLTMFDANSPPAVDVDVALAALHTSRTPSTATGRGRALMSGG